MQRREVKQVKDTIISILPKVTQGFTHIFRYDANLETWTMLEVKLSPKLQEASAMFVDDLDMCTWIKMNGSKQVFLTSLAYPTA